MNELPNWTGAVGGLITVLAGLGYGVAKVIEACGSAKTKDREGLSTEWEKITRRWRADYRNMQRRMDYLDSRAEVAEGRERICEKRFLHIEGYVGRIQEACQRSNIQVPPFTPMQLSAEEEAVLHRQVEPPPEPDSDDRPEDKP